MNLLIGVSVAVILGWMALSVPFFPGAGLLGIGDNVTLEGKGSMRSWVPAMASENKLLRIQVQGADSVVFYGKERRVLWSSEQSAEMVSISCRDLEGIGRLEVHARKRNAKVGFRLIGSKHFADFFAFLLVWGGVLLWARKGLIDKNLYALFILAVSFRFFYGYMVPWHVNSFDVLDHVDYVRLIALRGFLPSPGECLQCYQPPSYYVLAAVWYRLVELLGMSGETLLRVPALVISAGFLYLGIKAILYVFECPRRAFSPSVLFAFWPAILLSAPIINNDLPVNLLGMASFLALLKWRKERKMKTLFWGLLAAGCAALFKSSGLVYLGIWAVGMAYGALQVRRVDVKELGIFLFLCIGVLSAVMGVNFLRSQSSEGKDPLVGNIAAHAERYKNLVDTADLQSFLPSREGLIGAFHDRDDIFLKNAFTHSYWGAFLRSNIDGMFQFERGLIYGLGMLRIELTLLLLLWVLAAQGAFSGDNGRFHALCVLLFIMASMAFRWRYPFASSADARYIIGYAVPFAILVGYGIESWKVRWKLLPLGVVGGFAFVAALLYFSAAITSL